MEKEYTQNDLNKILLRRLNSVSVTPDKNIDNVKFAENKKLIATGAVNLNELGLGLSYELANKLLYSTKDQIIDLFKNVEDLHKTEDYLPMYPGYPNHLVHAAEAQAYFDVLNYKENQKLPHEGIILSEEQESYNRKIVHLAEESKSEIEDIKAIDDASFESMLESIINKKDFFSKQEQADLEVILNAENDLHKFFDFHTIVYSEDNVVYEYENNYLWLAAKYMDVVEPKENFFMDYFDEPDSILKIISLRCGSEIPVTDNFKCTQLPKEELNVYADKLNRYDDDFFISDSIAAHSQQYKEMDAAWNLENWDVQYINSLIDAIRTDTVQQKQALDNVWASFHYIDDDSVVDEREEEEYSNPHKVYLDEKYDPSDIQPVIKNMVEFYQKNTTYLDTYTIDSFLPYIMACNDKDLINQFAEVYKDNMAGCPSEKLFDNYHTFKHYMHNMPHINSKVCILSNKERENYISDLYKATTEKLQELYKNKKSLGNICLIDNMSKNNTAVEFHTEFRGNIVRRPEEADIIVCENYNKSLQEKFPNAKIIPVYDKYTDISTWKFHGEEYTEQFKNEFIDEKPHKFEPYNSHDEDEKLKNIHSIAKEIKPILEKDGYFNAQELQKIKQTFSKFSTLDFMQLFERELSGIRYQINHDKRLWLEAQFPKECRYFSIKSADDFLKQLSFCCGNDFPTTDFDCSKLDKPVLKECIHHFDYYCRFECENFSEIKSSIIKHGNQYKELDKIYPLNKWIISEISHNADDIRHDTYEFEHLRDTLSNELNSYFFDMDKNDLNKLINLYDEKDARESFAYDEIELIRGAKIIDDQKTMRHLLTIHEDMLTKMSEKELSYMYDALVQYKKDYVDRSNDKTNEIDIFMDSVKDRLETLSKISKTEHISEIIPGENKNSKEEDSFNL